MTERITERYTLAGVQHLIRRILDIEGFSPMDLAKASGLHFTGIYSILNKKESQHTRPVRRSTIIALGKGAGYDVKIDSAKKEIILSRDRGPISRSNDIEELLQELRSTLVHSGRRKFAQEEKERIVAVFKALVM